MTAREILGVINYNRPKVVKDNEERGEIDNTWTISITPNPQIDFASQKRAQKSTMKDYCICYNSRAEAHMVASELLGLQNDNYEWMIPLTKNMDISYKPNMSVTKGCWYLCVSIEYLNH